MSECVLLLNRDLPAQPDACCWLLSMLRRFPATLKELLLSPEDAVRAASGRVIKAALEGAMRAAGGAGDKGGGETEDAYLAAYTATATAATAAATAAAEAMEGGEGGREEEGSSRDSSGLTKEGPAAVAVGYRATPPGEEGEEEGGGRLAKRTVSGTVHSWVRLWSRTSLTFWGHFLGTKQLALEFINSCGSNSTKVLRRMTPRYNYQLCDYVFVRVRFVHTVS